MNTFVVVNLFLIKIKVLVTTLARIGNAKLKMKKIETENELFYTTFTFLIKHPNVLV